MTNPPTISVTPDQDAIVSEILIEAPPDRVFDALVDPKMILQWWGGKGPGAEYRSTSYENDLRPGGKWCGRGTSGERGTFEVKGEYVTIDRPRLLVHTWIASWTGAVETLVSWELEGVGSATRLRIRHSGLAAHPELSDHYRGWPYILQWIQALLETGVTVDTR